MSLSVNALLPLLQMYHKFYIILKINIYKFKKKFKLFYKKKIYLKILQKYIKLISPSLLRKKLSNNDDN